MYVSNGRLLIIVKHNFISCVGLLFVYLNISMEYSPIEHFLRRPVGGRRFIIFTTLTPQGRLYPQL